MRILILLLLIYNLFAQNENNEFKLFPENNIYQPNFSNLYESRIGFENDLKQNNLLLYVGYRKDIFHYSIKDENNFGFGLEFFNWTLLRKEANFKFPVMAIDYFFGLYFSNSMKLKRLEILNRFRISHISAHLADGNFNIESGNWIGNLPFVYSREFLEINSQIIYKNLKQYFGLTYLFHVQPDVKSKFIVDLGTHIDLYKLEELNINSFVSLDWKLYKFFNENFENDFTIDLGFYLGNNLSEKLMLYLRYFTGINTQGVLSTSNISRTALGFCVIM